MEKKLYTLNEVADYFRVTPRTIINWQNRGKIQFIYLPQGNMIRITQSEVDRILSSGTPVIGAVKEYSGNFEGQDEN